MDQDLIRNSALYAKSIGWRVVLLKEGEKRAAHKDWQEKDLTSGEINWWMTRYRMNYGLILHGDGEEPYRVCVVDKDAADRGAWRWWQRHGVHRATMQQDTSAGRHAFLRVDGGVNEMRSRLKWAGLPLDVLMSSPEAGRYVVGPGSWIADTEHRYQIRSGTKFLSPGALDPLPESIVEALNAKPTREIVGIVAQIPTGIEEESRLTKYVESIDRSEQGKSGSSALIKACLKILALVNDDASRAWPLVLHYNATRCVPPWDTEKEGGPDSLKRKFEVARQYRTQR